MELQNGYKIIFEEHTPSLSMVLDNKEIEPVLCIHIHDTGLDDYFSLLNITIDEWREFVRQGNEALGLEAK